MILGCAGRCTVCQLRHSLLQGVRTQQCQPIGQLLGIFVREDLRFVFAVLKIITDLERIGDQGVNIAKKAKKAMRK